MKKRNLLSLLCMLFIGTAVIAQTALEGNISDTETGEGLISATVLAKKNGVQVGGTVTDFDGNYRLILDPGTYDIEFSYTGYQSTEITGVQVLAGKSNKLDQTLNPGTLLQEVKIVAYKKPLVDQEQTTQGEIKTADDIRRAPTRNVNTLASTAPGVTSTDNGALNVRGQRSNATFYIVDGVRQFGALPAESEIEQLQVMTGGISASYGDATGGLISITTKGPSSRFTGGIEAESSGIETGSNKDDYIGLDAFGQSLIGGNISGPLLKKGDRTLLGFRLAGRYSYNRDDNANALGTFIATDEVLDRLENNPIANADGEITARPPTEELLMSDFELLDYTPNTQSHNLNLTAKLDARLTDAIDVTFTGGFVNGSNRFAPNRNWNWFNYRYNPVSDNQTYRGIFRFRHKLGKNKTRSADGEAEADNSQIRNFQYTLQFGYENIQGETYDPRHEDNLFRYGYVGKFDRVYLPTVSNDTSLNPMLFQDLQFGRLNYATHAGFVEVERSYQPDFDVNPILAKYNFYQIDGRLPRREDNYYTLLGPGEANSPIPALNVTGFDVLSAVNGRFNSAYNEVWNFGNSVGTTYNNYSKSESEIITGNVDMSFDFVPGGKASNRHSIILGFQYEERIQRAFSVAPASLWQQVRLLQNNALAGVANTDVQVGTIDLTNPTSWTTGAIGPVPDPRNPNAEDIVISQAAYAQSLSNALFNNGDFAQLPLYQNTLIDENNVNYFHRNIREALGLSVYDYVNLEAQGLDFFNQYDGLDVLGLFDPVDLVTAGVVSYYGYDITGEKSSTDISFNEFYNRSIQVDERTSYRPMEVAPVRPIYFAGYIEDNVRIKDAFLRFGVRVERFDANQQVLKDPYTLYDIATVGDLNAEDRPAGADNDWKVYVDNGRVSALRDGDQWYDAQGNTADPIELFGAAGRTNPLYADYSDINSLRTETPPSIQVEEFDPSGAFEDYKPQLNVLPRVAFSFPISDASNFFSHYDVRVQRPTSGNIYTALNYFNFANNTNRRGNPNLLPEKTVSFEVGFQQRVSSSSAIKFSFYYQEMRDMISTRLYQFLPQDFSIPQYETFTNGDFGTVKGFTFQYDLRRTGNFLMTLNYTLQFADGTGSSPVSGSGSLDLIGPRRTLFPLSFDERHILNASIDYRYGSGNDYNGPRVGGVDVLARTGLNIQMFAKSGRPYTPTNQVRQFTGFSTDATFNGARLPWNFRLDARLDKDFKVGQRKNGSPMYLNVYLRSQNLLDTRNIIGVYSATGEPDTDGFLSSALGIANIENLAADGRNVESYQDYYSMAVLVPGFYTLPRRLYLGAIMQF